jgi:hypothetical protein
MKAIRVVQTTLFLACAAPLLLSAQNQQGDLPRPNPGTSNPDLQQQRAPKHRNDKAQPSDGKTASPGDEAQGSSGASNNDSSSKKSKKKKRNPQGHGPQRHDPNSQS